MREARSKGGSHWNASVWFHTCTRARVALAPSRSRRVLLRLLPSPSVVPSLVELLLLCFLLLILAGRSAVDREFLYIEGSGRAADVAVCAAWYFLQHIMAAPC